MSLNYIRGNLFKAQAPCILAHACNTRGFWGGGVAYQFAKLFPQAELAYEEHCHTHKSQELLGTAFLINTERDNESCVIACLFTSVGGGGDADGVADIVKNTALALEDLKRQLHGTEDPTLLSVKATHHKWLIDMPMINAGIFRVPWEETESVLQKSGLDYNVYVV